MAQNTIVTFEMENGGKMVAELYPEVAPNTVNNFINLVQSGFYNGLIFHRVIPGFMIQGGCPNGNGMGGPGYSIRGEFSHNGVQNSLKHDRGVLSMARAMNPNSAGSQFFIMVEKAPHLDGEYAAFGKVIHPFTGVDYVDFYKGIIEDAGAQAEIVFANRVQTVLDYTDTVICCDIHTRQRSKRLLKKAGARVVLGLDDLLTAPVNGSGYNPQYGLLGSNKADDTRVKLFPRDADVVAEAIGQRLSEATGKRIEAMVYGDGAFKDPVGKIWELADPVVSPGYTAGLEGTPNELKLKYLADHDFGDLSGEALQQAVAQKIREKDASVSLVGNMVSEGTTPRHLTDLIGSLCDLTSGSGDKGTPVIYIQGYFDNYTNE